MLTAVVFLLILTTAVVIHELAHYWNAKSVGLEVRAFSVGMGPVIWRKMWNGTEWRLSLLPIGGYVDIPGMAPKQDDLGNLSHPNEGFATRTLPQKLWVLVGGVLANYILAIFLLSIVITAQPNFRQLTSGIEPQSYGAQIVGVVEESVAQSIGLEANDTIRSINGLTDPNYTQVTEVIQTAQDELVLEVIRNGETVEVSTEWPPEGVETPLLGIQVAPLEVEDLPSVNYAQALGESAAFSARIVPESLSSFARGIGATFTGRQAEDIAGPVRLVGLTRDAAQAGLIPVLLLAALINFSLAIFNLLPIPGLDGGRMLLATIVAARGKPFEPGREEFIHFLGFVAILAFIVLITFNEVSGLFTRG